MKTALFLITFSMTCTLIAQPPVAAAVCDPPGSIVPAQASLADLAVDVGPADRVRHRLPMQRRARHASFRRVGRLHGIDSAMMTQVLALTHADCEQVAKHVRSLFKDKGHAHKVTGYRPTNSVLMRGTASELEQMSSIISQIDVAPAKPEPKKKLQIKTKVLNIKHAEAQDLAEVLHAYFDPPRAGRSQKFVPVRVIVDHRLNCLIVKARKYELEQAMTLVRELDVPIGPSSKKAPGEKKQRKRQGKKKK